MELVIFLAVDNVLIGLACKVRNVDPLRHAEQIAQHILPQKNAQPDHDHADRKQPREEADALCALPAAGILLVRQFLRNAEERFTLLMARAALGTLCIDAALILLFLECIQIGQHLGS